MLNKNSFEMYENKSTKKEEGFKEELSDRIRELYPNNYDYYKSFEEPYYKKQDTPEQNNYEHYKPKHNYSNNKIKEISKLADKIIDIMLPENVSSALRESLKVSTAYLLNEYFKGKRIK